MSIIAIVPVLLYLGMLIFVIYFMVKILEYLRTKTDQDTELGRKLDRLIEAVQQKKQEEPQDSEPKNDLLD